MHAEESQSTDQTTHPETPDEYRRAIASLEASALAIESHITTTQQILDTLSATQVKNSRPITSNRYQSLSTQISSQHTTLTQFLTTTTSDLQRAIASTLITVDDTLSRDDYAFGQIAQSLSAIDVGSSTHGPPGHDGGGDDRDDDDPASRASMLLEALHRAETEMIRTRLERIYLDTLASASHPSKTTNGSQLPQGNYEYEYDHVDPTKTSAIQSDLRTLYAEIEDVTSLFIAHEHGDVLSKLNGEISRTKSVLAQQRGNLAIGQIREMRGQLLGVEEGVRGLQGHRAVVGRLRGLLGMVDGLGSSRDAGRADSGGLGGGAAAGWTKDSDGAALVALRGYLGIGFDVSGGGESRGERVDESFREVKGGVERALQVQRGQAQTLRRGATTSCEKLSQQDQTKGENRPEISRASYPVMLDELDGEIAMVKEGIEKLPPG